MYIYTLMEARTTSREKLLLVVAIVIFIIAVVGVYLYKASFRAPPPKGEVILTVEGKIRRTNQDGKLAFDIELLEKIADKEIVALSLIHI